MTTYELDWKRIHDGRSERLKDRVIRRKLCLKSAGYIYSSAGNGTRPYAVYRDEQGREWVRAEVGRYIPRDHFEREQEERRRAAKIQA